MKSQSRYLHKESFFIILIFVIANYGRAFITKLPEFSIENIDELWQRLFYVYGWEIGIVLIVCSIWFGKKLTNELGLNKGFLKGFGIAFLCTLPMVIGYFLIGNFIPQNFTFSKLLSSSVLPAFSEELLFRAFLFGLLFRRLEWGFIPAAFASAFIFGFGHLWQGNNFLDTLGVMAVTSMGGLWFAWLFAEWNYNLWLVIFLHLLMNWYWGIFEITNNNALGGIDSNIFRFITIIVSIVWTIRIAKKRNHFEVNKKRLF
ncbi:CPBP family intramembrane glutamic endopeptidase [Bernardetia sp. Wsw4-3y2]|uniref:CPBP family intramembrane glutamic endopeptidase n=1 Tax=Bernardetia sp. Wsw4-3y2 TaxID=3127471 RepID=UPI0030CB23D2